MRFYFEGPLARRLVRAADVPGEGGIFENQLEMYWSTDSVRSDSLPESSPYYKDMLSPTSSACRFSGRWLMPPIAPSRMLPKSAIRFRWSTTPERIF